MLKSIKLTNYKSIAAMPELKFGDTTFIIGKNGAGKTTLISAIYLTKQLAEKKGLDDALSIVAPFGFELFTGGVAPHNNTQIEVTVKGEDGCFYKLSYTIGFSQGSVSADYIITEENLLKFSDHPIAKEHPGQLIYKRVNDTIQTFVENSAELEAVPLNISPKELVLSSYSDPDASKVADLIRGYRILWFDAKADSTSFKVYTKDKLDVRSLDATVVNLYKTDRPSFNKAVHVITQLIPEFKPPLVQTINPIINKDKKDDKSKTIERYVVFWREQDLEYTISGLSDGNFRVIQLIFSLFSSKSSTCLIGEEIENGQHFGRIRTLLEVLKVLSTKLNVQLIFTTHSRELLGYVSPSDAVYCQKDDNGHSKYDYLEGKNVEIIKEELGRPPTAKDVLDFGVI